MDDAQIYEIRDGVRRAKAAQLCGREMVDAQIGGIGPVLQVPLETLRSPKDRIDPAGLGGMRWDAVYRATQAGKPLPPIEIMPGAFGVPIEKVSVPQDELEMFR